MSQGRKRNKIYETVKEIKKEFLVVEGIYAGIDEVGVSSIAGPMVAAVVILPINHSISEIPLSNKKINIDSKVQSLARRIEEEALFLKIFQIPAKFVSKVGEYKARNVLWRACANHLRNLYPNMPIVIDGKYEIEGFTNQQAIKKADETHANVSAADIIAKAWCDYQMIQFHEKYPQYDFKNNKGYAINSNHLKHFQAIEEFGMCDVHRRKFVDKAMKKYPTIKKFHEKGLTCQEMKAMFAELIPILKNTPEVTSERNLTALRGFYKMIFSEKPLTKKQQVYFWNLYRDIKTYVR